PPERVFSARCARKMLRDRARCPRLPLTRTRLPTPDHPLGERGVVHRVQQHSIVATRIEAVFTRRVALPNLLLPPWPPRPTPPQDLNRFWLPARERIRRRPSPGRAA